MQTKHDSELPVPSHIPWRPVVGFIVLTLLGVGIVSRYALLMVLVEAVRASIIMLPPMLAGLWLVPLLRLSGLSRSWHLLLGAGLGLGCTSLLVLLLGLAGLLQRGLWIGILVVLALAGIIRLHLLINRWREESREIAEQGRERSRYLWFLACPFLCLALLAASVAPGFIWSEEGLGYDVLEYHLQLPKEYLEAGQITYLPHNVYANFPANVEMWYLLAMIVFGEPVEAGVTANMIHLILGMLAVFGAWTIAREWSTRAGILSGLVLATVGWLPYLSGLAYVENGLLFFGMVATGLALRAIKSWEDSWRYALAAGLMAGFACGCKYTAAAMIAAPLALAIVLISPKPLMRRLGELMSFLAAAVLAFSPWLTKNQAMTGNPVFPLANTVFDASPSGWGTEQTRRWNAGHAPSAEEQTLPGKLRVFWGHVPGDKYQRFGPAILLLGVAGLIGGRWRREDGALAVILCSQLAVWLFATHLYARFAVVLLIPLALLAGRSTTRPGLRIGAGNLAPWPWLLAAALIGAAWNFYSLQTKLFHAEWHDGADAALITEGRVALYEYVGWVNTEPPEDAKVLLVGDARAFYFERDIDYCVVFNRSPFLEVLGSDAPPAAVVDWLQRQGYTHVLVNWVEIRRLSSTYGFQADVNPARFDALTNAGLIRLKPSNLPQPQTPPAELFAVPAGSPRG